MPSYLVLLLCSGQRLHHHSTCVRSGTELQVAPQWDVLTRHPHCAWQCRHPDSAQLGLFSALRSAQAGSMALHPCQQAIGC